MAETLLSGFRALDLTDDKGFICGQILASLGVDVIKIERPGGEPARNIPPFYHDQPSPERSLHWFAFNTNKRSITLDLEKNRGRDLFKKLASRADFVLESFSPGYLDNLGIGYEALSRLNKRIVVTSITHFGQKGPHSSYKGCEIIDSAMSGVMDNTGHPDRPPVKEAVGSIYFHAGAAAALGTLISHYYCQTTGEGQQVDVSIQEVAVSRTMLCLLPWQWDRRLVKRGGPMGQIGFRPFRWVWQCKDGYLFWMLNGGQVGAPANQALSKWMDEEGMENPLRQVTNWEELDMAAMTQQTHDAFQEAIGKFFLRRTKKEIAEEGLRRGINAVIASDPADVLSNPQLLARSFWTALEHPDLGMTFNYPRHFLLCSETENFAKHPAPNVGQDNTEICVRELAARAEARNQENRRDPDRQYQENAKAATKQALTGVRVLDFGWIIVGSLTGKHLADHGAQVVRVESVTRPDAMRETRQISVSKASNPDDKPMFNYLNTSKFSMALNLKHPRAKEVLYRLIRWADVVNENFTPGAMAKLGLSYEHIRKIKPDIIMVGSSVYGQTGPLARQWGLDGTGMTLSGHAHLTGWPDREPTMTTCCPYGDIVLPLFSASAIVAALDYRRRTGKGQYMDASMLEVCTYKISPALLDLQANGRLQTRTGNRLSYAAPHGVFPCLGDDRWCAIAVFNDEEWQSFCHVLGDPPWTREPRFSTLDLRKQNEDDLEKLVADWTSRHSAEDVMHLMQSAGVPAAVVQNARDILENDPQLKEREFLVPLKHPVLGVFGHPTPPYKLLGTKADVRTSPCFGEHTEYVCTKLLGMSDAEFVELLQEGVFK